MQLDACREQQAVGSGYPNAACDLMMGTNNVKRILCTVVAGV